mgnify:CR=1 FL=1
MLEFINLFELEVIVAPKLRVASSHGVGSFQQVIAEKAVTGLDQMSILSVNAKGNCPKIDIVFCPGTDENLAGYKRRVYRQGGINEKKERCGLESHLS